MGAKLDASVGLAENAFAVTAHDSNNEAIPGSALYVGGVGNLTLETVGGQVVQFLAVQAGTLIPVQFKRVNLTLLTASGLIGIY